MKIKSEYIDKLLNERNWSELGELIDRATNPAISNLNLILKYKKEELKEIPAYILIRLKHEYEKNN
ncbi:MAG: hypothetical protein I3273_04975 [Candidatus Moeniiplasma glomeromycotorum]|nr:hypothetical protein [Candidatus Moeniiplasma glomeromycotorum]MCE8167895.1 hypothetical protein [Candidatus Moeniiplasma glomeromycotorum]MCE8169445.1 hypothetical protein [Candidatus Moeniiplasma glomeromycotorum]